MDLTLCNFKHIGQSALPVVPQWLGGGGRNTAVATVHRGGTRCQERCPMSVHRWHFSLLNRPQPFPGAPAPLAPSCTQLLPEQPMVSAALSSENLG